MKSKQRQAEHRQRRNLAGWKRLNVDLPEQAWVALELIKAEHKCSNGSAILFALEAWLKR